MSDIKQEKVIKIHPISVSIEGTKTILFQMNYCIHKVYLNNNKIGLGFFCKIPINNRNKKFLPVIITSNNALNDSKNIKIIKLINNNKIKEIKIDNSRKKYINPDNNIAIIEIKPNKDKIYNYLELDENYIYKSRENIEKEYKNKSIYIIHYQKEKINVSYSLINDILDSKK